MGRRLQVSHAEREPSPDRLGHKNDFLAHTEAPDSTLSNLLVHLRSPYELQAGTIIPTVLITGLDSDLPGNILGQVSENVYDTVTGNYLLIPEGSRLIAKYDSIVSYGQERVLVCWRRIIRPDGTSISLDCMPGIDKLSNDERAIYDLIARRYIAQFFPSHQFHQTTLEVVVAGEQFRAGGRVAIAPGWRAVIGEEPSTQSSASPPTDGGADSAAVLPLFHAGDPVTAREVTIIDRKTIAPKLFTDATLLEAMTAIARFVSNPDIKRVLQETDGIGTPATQANIIQTLYDRGYLEKQKSHVVSTPVGRTLIATLPSSATTPDMTALCGQR